MRNAARKPWILAGCLMLLALAPQSIAQAKHGKQKKKKSDCATNAVAPGSLEGCGMCGAQIETEDSGEHCECVPGILEPNAIYLTVKVPPITLDCPKDAVVLINGDPTDSKGACRRFIIRNLEYGKEYDFEVVAITENRAGVELMQKKKVRLQVGDVHTVSMKPVRRKKDIEREEAEAAAKASSPQTDGDEEFDQSDILPEDVEADVPVAMAFPFPFE